LIFGEGSSAKCCLKLSTEDFFTHILDYSWLSHQRKDNQKQHDTVLNEVAKVTPWNVLNTQCKAG
jgi:hypothetical protein